MAQGKPNRKRDAGIIADSGRRAMSEVRRGNVRESLRQVKQVKNAATRWLLGGNGKKAKKK